MTPLATFIRAQMKALNLTQKELAGLFHDAPGLDLSFETVQPKLSKLLKGDSEGEDFFFANETRPKALAAALKTDVATLLERRAFGEKQITLVLDPRLGAEAIDFIESQSEIASGAYVCERVEMVDDVRTELKDRTGNSNNRWLVTNNDGAEDRAFYKGAEIKTTIVNSVPRGWSLKALPDLIPIPPPGPPRFWSDAGDPLAPCEQLTEQVRLNRSSGQGFNNGDMAVWRTIERGEEPTYSLRTIAREFWRSPYNDRPTAPQSKSPIHFERPRSPSLATLRKTQSSTTDNQPPTYVYWEAKQIFVVGPAREELAELFKPHTLEEPHWVDAFFRVLHRKNPRGLYEANPNPKSKVYGQPDGPKEVPTERGRTLIESMGVPEGISVDAALIEWSTAGIASWGAPSWPQEVRAFPGEEVERIARKKLLAVLERPIRNGQSEGTVLMLIRQIARADIAVLAAGDDTHLHVAVNLGAGRCLEVVVEWFDNDPHPLEIVRITGYTSSRAWLGAEGGDVHVWVVPYSDELLEGHTLTARSRREAEADD